MSLGDTPVSNASTCGTATIVEDIACGVCGCVCDDLRASVSNNRIVELQGACPLAEPWFKLVDAPYQTAPLIGGQRVTLSAAIGEAANVLSRSTAPLIYGLSRSSTDGQRAAVSLADCLGATIDTTASRCHAPSIMALQAVGESTCSLGEVRNRSDLVIYWGVDPVRTHPRHMERYALQPAGLHIPGGRNDRTLVVVDVARTATADLADVFIPIETGRDFDAIWALRAVIQGIEFKLREGYRHPGMSPSQLDELARLMSACRSGVVFFGLGLTQHALGHHAVEALLRLVSDLNRHTRFYARRMRIPGDVAGADSVLCWQTGYPFSVSMARGYPRYNPGEFSANEMLERGEPDACVIVGSEAIERLSSQAIHRLERIPSVVLDYAHVACPLSPHVHFKTAVYGVHVSGTAYRMDETPIPLRQFLECDLPTDGQILRDIEAVCRGTTVPNR